MLAQAFSTVATFSAPPDPVRPPRDVRRKHQSANRRGLPVLVSTQDLAFLIENEAGDLNAYGPWPGNEQSCCVCADPTNVSGALIDGK